MTRFILFLGLLAGSVSAESFSPSRILHPGSLIRAEDLVYSKAKVSGALTQAGKIIGKEAKVALYPNRPIFEAQLQLPAIVERNQPIVLNYKSLNILIAAEGRALARAAEGETIKAINVASKAIVRGKVQQDGSLLVSK